MEDNTISRIRERVNIVEIVGRYVSMKRVGKNWIGLCPFHSEKTPSFNVSEEKRLFYCFGCGEGGDVYKFLMKVEGRSFYDVLKELSEMTGIPLPKREESLKDREEKGKRERIYAINSFARFLYHRTLLDPKTGRGAMEYLEKRGVSKDTIDLFEIGLAPKSTDFLLKRIKDEGFSIDDAVEAGLVIKGNTGYYDRFRDRIIIPIISPSLKVLGFGGRTLINDPSKYINSPSSPVYNKSLTLYGIHLSASHIRAKGYAVIVEGYFDLISLYQRGVKNVVATCGTALSSDYLSLLSKYTDNIYIFFDADDAGVRAAERALSVCLDSGLWPSYIKIPKGLDPDDFARREKEQGLKRVLESASPLFDFVLEYHIKNNDKTPHGRENVLISIIPLLSKIKGIKEGFYTRKVSQKVGIREEVVVEAINTHRRKSNFAGRKIKTTLSERDEGEGGLRIPKKERALLSILLLYPRKAIPMIMQYDYRNFTLTRTTKEIIDTILMMEWEKGLDLPLLLTSIKEERVKNFLCSILFDERRNLEDEALTILKDLMNRFDIERVREIMKEIDQDIVEAERAGEDDRAGELTVKRLGYARRLIELEKKIVMEK